MESLQKTLQPIEYRPLDISQSEIRLLSFENTSHTSIRLSLSYVSLTNWKPEYLSFRDQDRSTSSNSQLCEAWQERHEFTLATPKCDIYDTITRFNWGDYICLSYAWGDCTEEKAIIFLDGIATRVSKRLEAALRDLRSSFECRLGMKVWVDALCINQADPVDRGAHVLRVKDIFDRAFAVTVWTKEVDDLDDVGFSPPGERLLLCEAVLRQYGRRALEELLGVRNRDWGVADEDAKAVVAQRGYKCTNGGDTQVVTSWLELLVLLYKHVPSISTRRDLLDTVEGFHATTIAAVKFYSDDNISVDVVRGELSVGNVESRPAVATSFKAETKGTRAYLGDFASSLI